MSFKGNIGHNSGIISTGTGAQNKIIHKNSKFTEHNEFHNESTGEVNNFNSEAFEAIKKITESKDLTQTQKDALTELINEAKKANQDESESAVEFCKKGFKMFMSGAGELVKEKLKTILPPLILSFFGLKQ